VAGILLAKLLDGHLASFVRSEGECFIVSVNGHERTISRDAWRLLPEQQAGAQDRFIITADTASTTADASAFHNGWLDSSVPRPPTDHSQVRPNKLR
jgi:hypothetical protein